MILSRIALLVFIYSTTSFGAFNPVKSFKKKSVPKIRVLIAKSLNEISISGVDLKRKLHKFSELKFFPGLRKLKFNCKSAKEIKSASRPHLLASLASRQGMIRWNKKTFLGNLDIISDTRQNSCGLVNELNIEQYLSGVLTKELNPSWPKEVLKAQAIAARSYALHKLNSKQVSRELGHNAYYDLENSEKHQVTGSADEMTSTTNQAALKTSGEILVDENGRVTPIFFHSKCGGRTLIPDQVWDNHVVSYKNVICPFCHDSGKQSWDHIIKMKRLVNFIKWLVKRKHISSKFSFIDTNQKITIAPDRLKNTKLRFFVGEEFFVIRKSLFRRYFGRVKVHSNRFKVSFTKLGLKLFGQGKGHGVGMCQLGALDLAKRGWSYKQILSYYFPGHTLKKIY